ncbi:NADAR family protein [Xanthovirga aplysinae]|uniref:NADAR family protein n=1 Tax=Xanthovirga aplysinae TaxID=2529853 RepID=UPI0012BCFD6C|nr:NADAR family protein [Xanthovirga aplysinae]MTI30960.1 NADAR family protein [Xanthovirga aplysinae]
MKYNLNWLLNKYDEDINIKFIFFWGHQPKKNGNIGKSCFSQWWESDFIHNGLVFSTAEKWMMFKKAELFKDEVILKKIITVNDPKEIKSLGRQIKNFDQEVWNEHKYGIVLEGNFLKFNQNDTLKDFLLNTDDAVIVEASPYDKVWGIGMKVGENGIENPVNWKGENLLGFALMEVRDIIIQKSQA